VLEPTVLLETESSFKASCLRPTRLFTAPFSFFSFLAGMLPLTPFPGAGQPFCASGRDPGWAVEFRLPDLFFAVARLEARAAFWREPIARL
jgi:hypothetical protein